jgi:hypothetical protein
MIDNLKESKATDEVLVQSSRSMLAVICKAEARE